MWRMEGKPAAPPHPFTDVTKDWQQKAISWLFANKITTGTSPTEFSPDDPATRGQLATFLYRYKGEPKVTIEPPRVLRRLWGVLTLTEGEYWTSLPSS
jgi:S-layer homology domain